MNIAVEPFGVPENVLQFVRKQHRLLIGGQWVEAASGETFATHNPADGSELARIASAGVEDVDRAAKAAREALENGSWATMTPAMRAKLIWRLADALESHLDEFAYLETLDNGKPLRDARTVDIPHSIELLRYNAGWTTKLNGEQVRLSNPGTWHAYTVREPVGVVGQIVPWNAPLMMAVAKIAPALAAGCTVILKPAEQTPLTALRLGQLICDVGFPDGVVNILTGFGETTGAAITAHPGVDKITFTGSTETGRAIIKAAAGTFKRVTLELGGKSPVLILPDADLSLAVPGAANAIFHNGGQVCVAGSRAYVHASIFDAVADGLAEQAASLALGHGLNPDTGMGPLVSARQAERVHRFVDEARSSGASVITGGERLGEAGTFVTPTVVAAVTPDMAILREEVFGPVLVLQRYDDLDTVVRQANDSIYGLAASVWTRSLSDAHRLSRRLHSGTVWINCHSMFDASLPIGGVKQSGYGRDSVIAAMDNYLEWKTICAVL